MLALHVLDPEKTSFQTYQTNHSALYPLGNMANYLRDLSLYLGAMDTALDPMLLIHPILDATKTKGERL